MKSQRFARNLVVSAIRRVVMVLTGLLVSGLVISWFVAGALIKPHRHAMRAPPAELNATAFTMISDSGATIAGWHTEPERVQGVVVLLHGIRSTRLSMLARARMLHQAGYATVMIDLQAHGESSGDAINLGFLEQHDARAAVEFARSHHPDQPVGVIGVSLGGAAAALASPLDIDALVLESVYPSVEDAIANRVRARMGAFSTIPATLLLIQLQPRLGISPEQLRPIENMSQIGCPVLVASGTEDLHTTALETRAMFAEAAEPKCLWLVEGLGHVDLLRGDSEGYQRKVLQFLQQHLRNHNGTVSQFVPIESCQSTRPIWSSCSSLGNSLTR